MFSRPSNPFCEIPHTPTNAPEVSTGKLMTTTTHGNYSQQAVAQTPMPEDMHFFRA